MNRPPVSVGSLRGMGRKGGYVAPDRGEPGGTLPEGPSRRVLTNGTDRAAVARPPPGRHPGGRRARRPHDAARADRPSRARPRERMPGGLPAPDRAAAAVALARPEGALARRARARAR